MDDSSIDLNIDHYSNDELIELLDIKTPLTTETIQNGVYYMLQHHTNNSAYQLFIQQVKDRLFSYLEDSESVIDDGGLLGPMPPNVLYTDDDRDLVIHQTLQTEPTFNQEIIKGDINPIKRRLIKKMLLIDTKFRHTYSQAPGDLYLDASSNVPSIVGPPCPDPIPAKKTMSSAKFTFQLPSVVKNVVSMKLSSFEFPNSIYVFDNSGTCQDYGLGTNQFTVIGAGPTSFPITIPEGNYASVAVDIASGKTTFTSGGDSYTIDFRVPWDPSRNIMYNAGWILGFREPTYTIPAAPGSTITSEGLLDLTGSKYIYLLVNDFNNSVHNNFIGVFDRSLTKTNILARISQSNISSGMKYQYNTESVLKERSYFGPVNIERLEIQILDDFDRIVNLNHMDFSFTLELDCIYNL